MKKGLVVLSSLLLFVVQAFASGDVVSGVKVAGRGVAKATVAVYHFQNTHKFTRGAVLSAGECAAGIAFSSNPAGAAAVGLPVLFAGNLSSYFMTKNPEGHKTRTFIGREVQNVSGAFCLGYGLSRRGRVRLSKPKTSGSPDPKDPPSKTPTPCQSCNQPGTGNTPGGGSTSGGGGSSSGGGSGSTTGGHGNNGNPPGIGGGNGGSGNGGGNGVGNGGNPGGSSGSNPGNGGTPGSGGSGSGSTGNGGGGSTGGGSRCIQDCGLGNGGINDGADTNKPPFPGKGPGSH